VGFPVCSQVFGGIREGLIEIANKDPGFILGAVGMQSVAVAESVGIVVTNDREPPFAMENFQLNGESENAVLQALVIAPNVHLPWNNADEPMPLHGILAIHSGSSMIQSYLRWGFLSSALFGEWALSGFPPLHSVMRWLRPV
jgi:hypothetical protein